MFGLVVHFLRLIYKFDHYTSNIVNLGYSGMRYTLTTYLLRCVLI